MQIQIWGKQRWCSQVNSDHKISDSGFSSKFVIPFMRYNKEFCSFYSDFDMGNACKNDAVKIDFVDSYKLKFKDCTNLPSLNSPALISIHKPSTHGPRTPDGTFVQTPILSPEVNKRLNEIIIQKPQANPQREYHGPFKFNVKNYIYMGEWQNHEPDGKGRGFYPDGSVFDGDYRKGLPVGFGRYIQANGDYYEGEVLNGLANGHGKYITNTSEFEGQFVDNIQNGYGKEVTKEFTFEGTYKEGVRLNGKLVWGQCKYTGDFVGDQYQGKGTFESPEGTYTGDFKHGKKEGFGVFQWNDKTVFKGEFKNDTKNGEGVLIDGQGNTIVQGRWQNDVFMPDVVKPFPKSR